MQRFLPLFLFGIFTVALGCRSDPHTDVYFDILNTEKRVLEDRLYALEYENETLKKKLETARKPDPRPEPRRPASSSPTDDAPPLDFPGDLPDIELPPGVDDELSQGSEAASFQPASVQAMNATSGVGSTPVQASSLRINSRLTGGIDLNGQPGDDGISVLIEPRDDRGHFVPATGPVSLVLLDPAKEGDAARVARWDFDADVAAKAMTTDRLDRGILFRVPWSGPPPENSELHLFARLTTPDGQTVEADRLIKIHTADLVAQRWTPRTPGGAQTESSPVVQASFETADDDADARDRQPASPAAVEPQARRASQPPPDPHATAGSLWSPSR